MAMTEEDFANRMGVAVAQLNVIARELNARADPHNAQFVVREYKSQGRGVILKVPANGSVFFSIYTYAAQDFRSGLREYLSEKGIVGEGDGFSCKHAIDKANTHNGTVCDFILHSPIEAIDVKANLPTLTSIKAKILKMLDDVDVFNVQVTGSISTRVGNTACRASKVVNNAGTLLSVDQCLNLLRTMQRNGLDLIGNGVRKPSGKSKRSSLNLSRIGNVLLALDFKENKIVASVVDEPAEGQIQAFRDLWGIKENSPVFSQKFTTGILDADVLNPKWIDEVLGAYGRILEKLTSGDKPYINKMIDWRRKQFEPPKDCLKRVDVLERSLLFAMSHGSHELFHTNVWSWLVRRNPEFAKVFFEDIPVGEIVDVKREQGNRDLTIWVKVGQELKAYVVENKFKSSAREDQLRQYEDALSDKFASGLLVTLDSLPKDFVLADGWRCKRQSEIVSGVMNMLKNGHFEDDVEYGLIASYAQITAEMSALFCAYRAELGDRWALALNHSEWEESSSGDLEGIRLGDIFKKMNASDFRTYIESRPEWTELRNRLQKIDNKWSLKADTGFLHKLQIVNCNLTVKNENSEESFIGLILQGNALGRSACSTAERWNKRPDKIYNLFKDVGWFDDSEFLRPGLILKKRTDKAYNKFETDKYVFVCQNIGVESDRFDYLAKQIFINIEKAICLLEAGKLDGFAV